MRRWLLVFAFTLAGVAAQIGVSPGGTSPSPPQVHLGATASCLSGGIRITGSFTVSSGYATYGSLQVSQIGTVYLPYAATQQVSGWQRRSTYARAQNVTADSKVLNTKNSLTWTQQDKITTWSPPNGDTWYEAYYDVNVVSNAQGVSNYDHAVYHCTSAGATVPRIPPTSLQWTTVYGTGS